MTHHDHKHHPDLSDGGPYHPCEVTFIDTVLGCSEPVKFAGISVRVWLAGQALSGIMSNPSCFDGGGHVQAKFCVREALLAADALLSALALHPEDVGGRG